jgi:hypothetical protein
MHPIIQKTFVGLSMQYYFLQFLFGLAIAAIIIFTGIKDGHSISIERLIFTIVSTLLYPYSRFVFESIIDFFVGENVFFDNIGVRLFIKFMIIVMCWALAIFVAPIGLAYLYYHHSKAER